MNFPLDLHIAFSRLNRVILDDIQKNGEYISCQEKNVLCRFGDTADYLFFLLSGEVVLFSGEERQICRLKAFQGHFGWNDYEEFYRYEAISDSAETHLFKIRKETLYTLFTTYSQLRYQLFPYLIPLGAHLFFRTPLVQRCARDEGHEDTSAKGY